jgi:acyl carrier protein
MTEAQILAGIGEVARRHLGWEGPVEAGMSLVEDLGLDSLKTLTLAVEVENLFRVRLDPERDRELVTVGDLVGAVRRELGS